VRKRERERKKKKKNRNWRVSRPVSAMIGVEGVEKKARTGGLGKKESPRGSGIL
jgi:hypothetical protein